ncbi:MAG: hypothetical protein WA842_01340 [Croceibacterium sp.]
MVTRIFLILACLVTAVPALAQQGAQVPEGSQLTLFALGVLGVIIGRRASMGGKRDED